MELSKDLLKYYGNRYVLLYNYYTNKICLIKKHEFDLLEQEKMNEIKMREKEWTVLVRKGIVILNQDQYQSMSYISKYQEQIKNRYFKIDTVYFHVTQRCNLQCEYCYNKKNLNKRDELTTEKVFCVIDILKKADVKNIILTGGEALLRKDIIDIAKNIKQKGFLLTLLTNGVLLGAKSQILKFIDSAIISIDTFDIQKNLRKGLDIETLIENLKGIEHSLRSKIYLRSVISRQDMNSWKSIKEFCKQNNYKFLKSIYIPSSKDEIELVPNVDGVNENEESSENTTNMGGSICGASYKEIAIDANGDIYPCQMLINGQWKLGNIFEKNALFHQSYPEIVGLFKKRDMNMISSCNMCEYKYLCGGGCPAISYYLYKDTQVAPAIACDFIKAEINAKMIRMLKEYEKNYAELEALYYKELVKSGNSIEETVFIQNDSFFDIFNQKPVFNILSLLHIPYFVYQKSLYINRQKVDSINGISPYAALSKYRDYYTIDYESSKTEILKYPEIQEDSDCKECKEFIGKDEVYFKINDFSTFNINKLLENQRKTLFLDLRDNGGGSLVQMLSLLELFIKGNLFYLYNKSSKLIVTTKNELLVSFNRIILLVSSQTASAAEFFARTLKNYINCIIVGEKTYGKWVAHKVIKMEGYYIKIPIYKYENISGKAEKNLSGIKPDLCLSTAKEYTDFLNNNGIFL